MKWFPFVLLLVFLSGCVTKPVDYYYGNYSRTLYHAKKDNTPESVAKHKQTLLDIIETSQKKNLRVPPGICCEYAYVLAREGSVESDKYFALEVKNYPESARFVDFIRAQLRK